MQSRSFHHFNWSSLFFRFSGFEIIWKKHFFWASDSIYWSKPLWYSKSVDFFPTDLFFPDHTLDETEPWKMHKSRKLSSKAEAFKSWAKMKKEMVAVMCIILTQLLRARDLGACKTFTRWYCPTSVFFQESVIRSNVGWRWIFAPPCRELDWFFDTTHFKPRLAANLKAATQHAEMGPSPSRATHSLWGCLLRALRMSFTKSYFSY